MKSFVAVAIVALLLVGCSGEPRSSRLAEIASESAVMLDRLVRLTTNEDGVVGVTDSKVRLRDRTEYKIGDPAIEKMREDWSAVARFVDDSGALGLGLSSGPREVAINFYAYGLTSGGYSKGLMWLEVPPQCVEDVDDLIGKTGRGYFYSRTSVAGWYVFLKIDG